MGSVFKSRLSGNRKNISGQALVGLSAGSHFITDVYQNFYIGLIPFLTLKFGLSLAQISLLGATSIIANSFFSPVFGYMSDRYGYKYFVISGPLFSSIFLSIIGILPKFWMVLAVLFFGNLAIAAFHPSSASIAGYHGGAKKGLGTSLINFGGIFGSAIGTFFIILIYQKAGINKTPALMFFGLITTILLIIYLPKGKKADKEINPAIYYQLKMTDKNKIALLAILIFTIYALYIVWISIVNYMPVYFTDKKISILNIGIILFLFAVAGGSGGFFSGFIYDRFKNGNIIIQAGLLVSVFILFYFFKMSGLPAVILFIVSGFFLISVQPLCIRMSQDLLPSNMGFASSLIMGVSAGLSGVTIIFLGKAADKTGIVTLIQLELIILVIAFIILFAYPYFEKKLINAGKTK